MRHWTHILPATLGFLLTGGCSSSSPDSPPEAPADVTGVLEFVEAYNLAWETLSVDSILAFHASDFDYYWFDQHYADDFAQVLRDVWLAETQSYSIEMIDPSVMMFGRAAALVSFLYEDREVRTEGDTLLSRGTLGYVLERTDGEWKVARIHHAGAVPEDLYQERVVTGQSQSKEP